jgi:hypothetical protein
MRRALANLNKDELLIDSRYVMQITGDDRQGKQELDNFIDPVSRYPVIATTSKRTSTPRTGWDGKTWGSNQKISLNEAISVNTLNGAYNSHEEDIMHRYIARAMREATAGSSPECAQRDPAPPPDNLQVIRRIAWQYCGIIRTAEGLTNACTQLEALPPHPMRDVALLIARAALARQESRGAHFRSDYPLKDPAFEKHSMIVGDAPAGFR